MAPDQAVFKQNPLFGELSEAQLVSLAGLARRQRFARGAVVFREGDDGTALFIIERGRVKIVLSSPEGKERILALLRTGDFFGELALLDGGARSADAVALEDSDLLVLPREAFLGFLSAHPGAAINLVASLSKRLRHTDMLVHDAAFFDVRGRLARTLLDLAQREGEGGPDGILICPRLSQTELANMVGTTRESINKWIRFYGRLGAVQNRGGRLVLVDPSRLRTDIF